MRNVGSFKWLNDGIRSICESIIYPEVEIALNDWKTFSSSNSVLIGGLAYSFYCKPRATQDIDLMFLSLDDIPNSVFGFKRIRNHSFQHNKTHVEVEVLDPDYLDFNKKLIERVFLDSVESDGIKIASPKSLVVLKLNRYNQRDKSDIDDLLKYQLRIDKNIDFSDWDLTETQTLNLNNSISNLDLNENNDVNSFVIETYSNRKNIQLIESNKDFKISIIKDKWSEPCFYFFNKVNRLLRFDDYIFCIKIPKDINEELEIIESSSNFKSFTGYEKEKLILKNWLSLKKLEYIKSKWLEMDLKK